MVTRTLTWLLGKKTTCMDVVLMHLLSNQCRRRYNKAKYRSWNPPKRGVITQIQTEISVIFELPFNCLTDRPGAPTISNTERTVPGCNVNLKWTKPQSNGCPILFYTVHYIQKGTRQDTNEWRIINVTDPKLDQQEIPLNCTTSYEFKVKAWNVLGSSGFPPEAWTITTGEAQRQRDPGSAAPSGIGHWRYNYCFFEILFRGLFSLFWSSLEWVSHFITSRVF